MKTAVGQVKLGGSLSVFDTVNMGGRVSIFSATSLGGTLSVCASELGANSRSAS